MDLLIFTNLIDISFHENSKFIIFDLKIVDLFKTIFNIYLFSISLNWAKKRQIRSNQRYRIKNIRAAE